jgi:2'-5' RNA ligase
MRLFIAINIDPSLKAPLGAIQEKLKATRAPVSWVKVDNLHFTLKFLGEVAESRVPALREVFGRSLAGVPSFPLALGGLGTFPPTARPRVIWIGVQRGAAEVERLRGRVEEMLVPLGFPREARPFHPHLTLGRVKQGGRLDALHECLRRMEAGEVGRMQVASVELMQSRLHPAGAIYAPVETVPLTEAP